MFNFGEETAPNVLRKWGSINSLLLCLCVFITANVNLAGEWRGGGGQILQLGKNPLVKNTPPIPLNISWGRILHNIQLLFFWFCRSFFTFILYLLTLSVIHVFTALFWSRSLTHNAVNSSNSLRDAGRARCCTMHRAFGLMDVSDVNIVYLEWTLDDVWCPEHRAKCTMSTLHIVQRLDDVLCTMSFARCTMSKAKSILWSNWSPIYKCYKTTQSVPN